MTCVDNARTEVYNDFSDERKLAKVLLNNVPQAHSATLPHPLKPHVIPYMPPAAAPPPTDTVCGTHLRTWEATRGLSLGGKLRDQRAVSCERGRVNV